jgi:O-antigen/teichoic acid export membrane protein
MMKEQVKTIGRSILFTSGARIYLALVGILTLYITARHLGPEGRGELAIASTWATTFSTFFYLSLGQVASHRLGKSPTIFDRLAATLLWAAGILGSLAVFYSMLILYFKGLSYFGQVSESLLIVSLLTIPFLIWDLFGTSLLAASNQISKVNKIQIALRSIHALAILALALSNSVTVKNIFLLNVAVQVSSSIFLAKAAFKSGISKAILTGAELKDFLFDAAKLHLNAIGMFFIAGFDIILLAKHGTNQDVGIYQLSQQVIGMVQIIPVAISQVLYGQITSNGLHEGWPAYKRIVIITLITMTVGAVFCGITAQYWLPVLVGNKFQDSLAVLYIFLLGVGGFTLSTIMSPQWICRGYFKTASGLTIGLGLASLGLNLILIPSLGALGGAYTFLFSYSISFLVNCFFIFKIDTQEKRLLSGNI